jgi:hypothetical protein
VHNDRAEHLCQHHTVDLREVESRLRYERVVRHDCESWEKIERFEEQIDQELILNGDLNDEERQSRQISLRLWPAPNAPAIGLVVCTELPL